MAEDFDFFNSATGISAAGEVDPAAAFLAQQESEIAGIESDDVGFGFGVTEKEGGFLQHQDSYDTFNSKGATMNGDLFEETDGPQDGYSAIAHTDRLYQEPESIRKWREEQKKRIEHLETTAKKNETEWREKAKKELDDWYARQNEQQEKTKKNNRVAEEGFVKDSHSNSPGTEWEKVASLCDFNPKASKQTKDVSRMRSVLISLKQSPLIR
ncbi:clathrin light chain B isoform X2 [Protopterus annectens]|uniref:clathrin light chain B isoform X2 n=1 Tax=Protopterus annectens TaxID=7888 RepID=UPI001CFB054F|nr:clathrin light chain B isoform X2 [Protopterus annectens]